MMRDVEIPLLLLCLAAGYSVLVTANKQERPLDKLGRLIGGLVLVLSFLGLICAAVCKIGCLSGHCPLSGKPTMCEYHPGAPATPPVSAAAETPSAPQ